MKSREEAWCLLTEFTQSESLRKHALAVEACMRAYAQKLGEDQELWAAVGLLHDFDYEKYPSREDHPYEGNEILKEQGWPDEIRRAIMSHAEYTGVTRDSAMEKALFACDELAGFITACALVKPGKSLAEVEAKSVRKKMKDKAFARSVNRDDIVNGAADLGVDLEEHIAFCHRGDEGDCGTSWGWMGALRRRLSLLVSNQDGTRRVFSAPLCLCGEFAFTPAPPPPSRWQSAPRSARNPDTSPGLCPWSHTPTEWRRELLVRAGWV